MNAPTKPTKPDSFLCSIGFHKWEAWTEPKIIPGIVQWGDADPLKCTWTKTTRFCKRCNKYEEQLT